MLLSDWILSKRNEGLTLPFLKWILANASSIPPKQFSKICLQADHPLLQDETIFDDIPDEVRALFVATPLLPHKHFNSAFAWLFGKENINDINAEDVCGNKNPHIQREANEPRYELRNVWSKLPFTKDEYDHFYSTIKGVEFTSSNSYLDMLIRGMREHRHVSLDDASRSIICDRNITVNKAASVEVADYFFDYKFKKLLRKFNPEENEAHRKIESSALELVLSGFLSELSEPLQFENLSRNRRDRVLSTFGLENVSLKHVYSIYHGQIPSDVMKEMFKMKKVTIESISEHKPLISDERIPLKLATKAAYLNMSLFNLEFRKRSDVTQQMKLKYTSDIRRDKKGSAEYGVLINELFGFNALTPLEIETIEHDDLVEGCTGKPIFKWAVATGNELSPALQDKWIGFERMSGPELQIYRDIPKIISVIREHYIIQPKSYSPIGSKSEGIKEAIASLLKNKNWTGELLLELIKLCKQEQTMPEMKVFKYDLEYLCKGALCKLFSESIYPNLIDSGNGAGKYGPPEAPIAYLLSYHGDMLSECDINLIAQSNIEFNYKDKDVDLGHAIRMHPGLNEAVIAQQLKRRLEKIGDMSTSPRKSHHI